MLDVPAPIPVIIADEDPIDATDGFDEYQVPPPPSVNADVAPMQIVVFPVIAVGNGFTVTTALVLQPPGIVYVIVAVPEEVPVTTPLVLIVPIKILLVLHAPPAFASLKAIVLPTQTFVAFWIADIASTVSDILI